MDELPNRSQGERWWIHGPTHDETLHSITERAWRCYGSDGHTMRRRVWPRATTLPGDDVGLDGLSAREICVLARAVGVSPRELYGHRLPDHPLLLQEDQRRAYCPSCWREDGNVGHPPSFRRAWMGVFTLNCPLHGLPLHWSSPATEAGKKAIDTVPTQPQSAHGRRILKFIEHFAYVMEQSLATRAVWPEGWRGDAYAARALLMRCVVNLGRMIEHPPFVCVTGTPDLAPFVNTPRRRVAPLQESPWEIVRAMGPPSWRRAALWMVSKYVIPHRSPSYRPEGLPLEAFAALDEQWNNSTEHRDLRRVQQYRHALRTMCRPFPVGWER